MEVVLVHGGPSNKKRVVLLVILATAVVKPNQVYLTRIELKARSHQPTQNRHCRRNNTRARSVVFLHAAEGLPAAALLENVPLIVRQAHFD